MDGYPFESLPLALRAEKLVELCIINSDVQKLWDGVQDLVNLKKMDLSGSEQLTELPDFSKARYLEEVNLFQCKSLCSVDASMLSCHTLISLNLLGCSKLKSLQSEIHFESLQHLSVETCFNLKEFLLSSEKIESLNLEDTKIEKLHSSFGHFKVLSNLFINGSTLKCLPVKELCMLKSLSVLSIRNFKREISKIELIILFDALPNLESLRLEGCLKLFEIPDNISALSRLKSLYLNKSGVETLPASIKLLSNLDRVDLEDCKRLRCLPELPPCIRKLDFIGCTSLETLPTNMKHLLELKGVDLKDCRTLECVPELPPSIKVLNCAGCTSLKTVHLPVNHYQTPEYLFFSFLGCIKMDEQSLDNFMEFSRHIAMMRPPYNPLLDNYDNAWVSYPGSRVPKWLKYKETQKANSITFELIAPSSPNPLLGFVCCCVLLPPQLPFTTSWALSVADFRCEIWALESFLGSSTLPVSFNLEELNMEHVFLCHCELLEKYKIITTSKFECRFFLEHREYYLAAEFDNYDELIKACGVSPVYGASDDDDADDDDDEHLLPPTKKLKQTCLMNHVDDDTSHES